MNATAMTCPRDVEETVEVLNRWLAMRGRAATAAITCRGGLWFAWTCTTLGYATGATLDEAFDAAVAAIEALPVVFTQEQVAATLGLAVLQPEP